MQLGAFVSSDLIKAGKYLQLNGHNQLYKTIVAYINAYPSEGKEIVIEFMKVFNSADDLNNIKGKINRNLSENVACFEEYFPYMKDKALANDYIGSGIISRYVDAITGTRAQNDLNNCKAVKVCNELHLLPESVRETYLAKIIPFIKKEASVINYNFWFEQVSGVLSLGSGGQQLFSCLISTHNQFIFPNKSSAPWKGVLSKIVPLFEEYFLLGEPNAWAPIAALYRANDDEARIANSVLSNIVDKTEVTKWGFIKEVTDKTAQINLNEEFYLVLGKILEKIGADNLETNNTALLTNWLKHFATKGIVSDDDKRIINMFCSKEAFASICKQDPLLTQGLFIKSKELLLKSPLNAVAELILNDASPIDIKYLIDKGYDNKIAIKKAIKESLGKSSVNNGDDWMNLVIENDSLWTKKEYGALLENRLIHLVTGSDPQKEKLKSIWPLVNKEKISQKAKETIMGKLGD